MLAAVITTDTDHDGTKPANEFAQRVHSARSGEHLRMKCQGLCELFLGIAEALLDAPRWHFGGTAIAQHPKGRAYGLY
ncbi:MAG TPA: hypothetical protein VK655_04160, partial [Solirubrobacteraceae bacterium]|nr:hypothetical protein [Solirubrobacteraceae bacterium]